MAARNALVKELRAEGASDEAAAVKKLRRPTVAAAAVNRVVRNAPEGIDALLAVGDRLRAAHEDLLEGRGDAGIRAATAERRRLVAALAAQAVEELGAGGASQQEAITHTLDAAVADVGAAEEVRSGRLTTDLAAPSGFGGAVVLPEAPPPPPEREEQERAERERQRTLRTRAADDAVSAARAAADEAAAGRDDVARLREELTEAEERLARAEERERATARQAEGAQQELRRLNERP